MKGIKYKSNKYKVKLNDCNNRFLTGDINNRNLKRLIKKAAKKLNITDLSRLTINQLRRIICV